MSTAVEAGAGEMDFLKMAREKPAIEAKAKIGAKGRLVIPAAIREALGLRPGDALDMRIENGELRITTRWTRIRRAQERARQFVVPGVLISDELIAERRAEFRAEFPEG